MYVFWAMMSPAQAPSSFGDYNGIFNWTVSYRPDSDFYLPYVMIYSQEIWIPSVSLESFEGNLYFGTSSVRLESFEGNLYFGTSYVSLESFEGNLA